MFLAGGGGGEGGGGEEEGKENKMKGKNKKKTKTKKSLRFIFLGASENRIQNLSLWIFGVEMSSPVLSHNKLSHTCCIPSGTHWAPAVFRTPDQVAGGWK